MEWAREHWQWLALVVAVVYAAEVREIVGAVFRIPAALVLGALRAIGFKHDPKEGAQVIGLAVVVVLAVLFQAIF